MRELVNMDWGRVWERAHVAGNRSDTLEDVKRYQFASGFVQDKIVLDIACGTGYGSTYLKEVGHAQHVYGVDHHAPTIEQHQRTENVNGITYLHGSTYRIPLDAHTCDTVVSLETIEHLDNPESFLREVKRVLKPTGQFLISTPKNETESRFQPSNPYHVREYSESELLDILQRHFSNLSVFYQSNVQRDNWINLMIDTLLEKLGVNLRCWKNGIPRGLRRSIRRLLRAERKRTIASDITDCQTANASVMLVLCTPDEPTSPE